MPPGYQAGYEAPSLSAYGFEHPNVDVNNPTFSGNWNGWTINGAAGFTLGDDGFADATQVAPEGTRVGYISTGGTMSFQVAAPSLARIRLSAAQRLQGSSSLTPDSQAVRMYIDDVLVEEIRPTSGDFTEFISRPIVSVNANVTVRLEAQSAAGTDETILLDEVVLEGVVAWDNGTSWLPAGVPDDTHSVLIPTGVRVALDSAGIVPLNSSTPVGGPMAASIDVEGALLVADRDATLNAANMRIAGPNGLFEVGQAGAPYLDSFTLTLTEPDGQAVDGNYRFLMVNRGGMLDLHGSTSITRARLTGQSNGLDEITLDTMTGWGVDDTIIVTGVELMETPGSNGPICDTTPHGNALERTITEKINGGLTFELNQPMPVPPRATGSDDYDNWSPLVTPPGYQANEWELDQRSYVGSLSRNIVIQGPDSSTDQNFGGHIMVAEGPLPSGPTDPTAWTAPRCYLESVELRRMGQEFKFGRYPLHWHMMTDRATDHYVRNCSIHSSFNRAIVIHGTDGILVEGNVVYESYGHAIFLEDGSEQENEFYNNLIVGTRRPDMATALLLSDYELCTVQDRTPASFWITNPVNSFKGNVVSDSVGTAYWFAFPQVGVLGASGDHPKLKDRKPRQSDLSLFQNNVALTCGTGLDINDIILEDHSVVRRGWMPPSPVNEFLNFVAYGCYDGIYSAGLMVGRTIRFTNPMLADNVEALRIASGTEIESGLIVADSENMLPRTRRAVAFVLYDGSAQVNRCHFVGFEVDDSDPMSPAFISNSGGRSNSTGRMITAGTFQNVNGKLPYLRYDDDSGWPTGGHVYDDRTYAHYGGNPRKWGHTIRLGDAKAWLGTDDPVTVTGLHPLVVAPSATLTGPPMDLEYARLSSDSYGFFRLRPLSENQEPPVMRVHRRQNNRSTPPDPMTGWYWDDFAVDDDDRKFPAIVNDDFKYYLDFPGFDESAIDLGVEFRLDDVEPGHSLILRIEDFTSFDKVSIDGGNGNLSQFDLISKVESSVNSAYAMINGRVWLKLVADDDTSPTRNKFVSVQFRK